MRLSLIASQRRTVTRKDGQSLAKTDSFFDRGLSTGKGNHKEPPIRKKGKTVFTKHKHPGDAGGTQSAGRPEE